MKKNPSLFQWFLIWKVVRAQNLHFHHRSLSLRAKSYSFKDQEQNLGMVIGPGGSRAARGILRGFPANLNTVVKNILFHTQGPQACFVS